MTMEWAREVEIWIWGRRVGVQGPVVMIIVDAERVMGEPDGEVYVMEAGLRAVQRPLINSAPRSWARERIVFVNL